MFIFEKYRSGIWGTSFALGHVYKTSISTKVLGHTWLQSAAVSNSIIHLHHRWADKALKTRRQRLSCIDPDQTWGQKGTVKRERIQTHLSNQVLLNLSRRKDCWCQQREDSFFSCFSVFSPDLFLLPLVSLLLPPGPEVKVSTRHSPPGWGCQGALEVLL